MYRGTARSASKLAVFLSAAIAAAAHAEPSLSRAEIQRAYGLPAEVRVSCSGLPQQALKSLPADVSKFFALDCTKYGQMLIAAPGLIGKWQLIPKPFFVSAQGNEIASFVSAPDSAYFVSAKLEKFVSLPVNDGPQPDASTANWLNLRPFWRLTLQRGGLSQALDVLWITSVSDDQGRTLTVMSSQLRSNDIVAVTMNGMPVQAWLSQLTDFPDH